MQHHIRNIGSGFVLGFVLLAAGCHRESIQVYDVPKEGDKTAQQTPRQPAKAPAGWTAQPADNMRFASFSIAGPDGKSASVSVTPLGGVSGIEDQSINMWKAELGLNPSAQDAAKPETVSIGRASGQLFDFAGERTTDKGKVPARIIGAVTAQNGATWFFKMTGDPELVEAQKSSFKQFLKDFEFPESSAPPAVAGNTPPMQMPGAPPMPALPGADNIQPAGGNARPAWDVPAGWEAQPASGMRVGTFFISSAAGKAELAVTTFPGTVGGTLANVNRWRGQMGLPEIDESEVAKQTQTVDASGSKAVIVDILSADQKRRLLGAMVPQAGQTWFYKLTGPSQLVESQKETFIQFVKSVRYPNAQ